jgi:hypothetical protein
VISRSGSDAEWKREQREAELERRRAEVEVDEAELEQFDIDVRLLTDASRIDRRPSNSGRHPVRYPTSSSVGHVDLRQIGRSHSRDRTGESAIEPTRRVLSTVHDVWKIYKIQKS